MFPFLLLFLGENFLCLSIRLLKPKKNLLPLPIIQGAFYAAIKEKTRAVTLKPERDMRARGAV
jgi:hypothetical protein